MSIEQKIAELLAESQTMAGAKKGAKDVTAGASAQEASHIANADDGETEVAGDEPSNAKNNVNKQNGKAVAEEVEAIDEVSDSLKDAVRAKRKEQQGTAMNAAKASGNSADFQKSASMADKLNRNTKLTYGKHVTNKPLSLAREELDITEDVAALVDGEELTEEFKEKAATIFEAAILSRVKQEVAKLDESYQNKLAEEVEMIKEGLVEKVDGYLDYVVEQWMEQNEIALESGMKSEILEGFVGGLKSLFEEHYIDVPEEKFDVMESLEEEADNLRAMLDEQLESNVGLKAQLAQYQVNQVIDSLSEGLAETDKEKFHALVEELDFDGLESFEKKVQTIRENYFTNKATTIVVESVITDTPVTLTEQAIVRPEMRGYVSALNNLK